MAKDTPEFKKTEGDGGGKGKFGAGFKKAAKGFRGQGKTASAKKGKHATMGAYKHK